MPAQPINTDSVYDINTMVVFAFMGVCIKMFLGGDNSADGASGPASSTVWGYGVVAIAVMTIMIIGFALGSQKEMASTVNSSAFSFLKAVFQDSYPAIFTLVVLAWIIVLNLTYYTRINQGHVAQEYYMFSNTTSTLMIFQLMALFKYFKGRTLQQTPEQVQDNGRMGFAIYFLTFLNLVLAGMMNITLEYFSTDG